MEKLSIEEKAKAYDEAKARMSRAFNSNRCTLGFMNEIFPELKESEDERIRKELINYFAKGKEYLSLCSIGKDDILAWLEKQGDDKVEQKFKIGDWVVFNNKHQSIYQVEKIEDGYYILRHTHGGTFRVCVLHDECLRPWTIRDAKDGDMLAMSAGAFIYNGNNGGGSCPGCYCGINTLGNFKVGVEHHWTGRPVFPATKEQRDTLFAKMKEAGYAFDFEKKELKKLGQPEVTKTSDQEEIAEIPFGAKDSELQEATYFIPKGFHAEIDDDKVVIKKGEKPTAWSEEDERLCLCLIKDQKEALDEVRNDKYGHSEIISDLKEMYRERIDWLKSLRPQNNWKPSDEQMKQLGWIAEQNKDNMIGKELISLYQDLKKLREE